MDLLPPLFCDKYTGRVRLVVSHEPPKSKIRLHLLLHYRLHGLLPITSWRLQGDSRSGDNPIAYFKRHVYIEPN